jgi:hypothetical protein
LPEPFPCLADFVLNSNFNFRNPRCPPMPFIISSMMLKHYIWNWSTPAWNIH